jgi:hypothetical protein
MGDVDHAHALCSDRTDQPEQLLGLALRERSGRLIEDQHRRLLAERLGDLHHLLLRAWQMLHRLCGVEHKAEPSQNRFGLAAQCLGIE